MKKGRLSKALQSLSDIDPRITSDSELEPIRSKSKAAKVKGPLSSNESQGGIVSDLTESLLYEKAIPGALGIPGATINKNAQAPAPGMEPELNPATVGKRPQPQAPQGQQNPTPLDPNMVPGQPGPGQEMPMPDMGDLDTEGLKGDTGDSGIEIGDNDKEGGDNAEAPVHLDSNYDPNQVVSQLKGVLKQWMNIAGNYPEGQKRHDWLEIGERLTAIAGTIQTKFDKTDTEKETAPPEDDLGAVPQGEDETLEAPKQEAVPEEGVA